MKRTTAEGNLANKYTEGDPGLGVPATVVGDSEMNNIQEELALTVEQAGLVVDQTGATENQIIAALAIFLKKGGIDQQNEDIDNNVVDQLIDNTIFESDSYRRVAFDYMVERTTDSNVESESGTIVLKFFDGSWSIDWAKDGDDLADIDFGIEETDLGGGNFQVQLKYTTDDLVGTTYVGNIYFTNGRIL